MEGPAAVLGGSLATLDRRGFLRLAGAAATAVALPAGCGGVPPDLAPPPGLALLVLTPRTYAVFTAFLVVVSLLATWLPVRRATRVNPATVLRQDW